MKKKILYIAVGLVVLGTVLVIIKKEVLISSLLTEEANTETGEVEEQNKNGFDTDISPVLPESSLPLANDSKTLAWNLFQKYLNYNKDVNLVGVKSVVHQVSKVCDTDKATEECKTRMTSAYQYGKEMAKESFTNVWADERQIILVTDFWTEEGGDMVGRFRSILYFIKDPSGTLKLLSFSPTKGGAIDIGEASKKEVNDRIIRYTEDKDSDGIEDYTEECLDIQQGETCMKTNPKLRDTDSDGWWDGTEALLNK